MTDDSDSNPVSRAFELQRKTIEQSQEAMKQGLEFQQRLNEALVRGVESGSEARDRGTEMTRDALHNTLDAIEEMVPDASGNLDQVRESIDEQFDAAKDASEEASERAVEFTEGSLENVEQASESYLDSVDDQLDTMLAAHEDLEEQTLEFIEQSEAQIEKLQEQTGTDVAAEQVEQVQERMQELRDQFTGEPNSNEA